MTPPAPDPDSTTVPRVIIADDDPVVRAVLTRQLEDAFEVVGVARDAAEAVELAERCQPDVALLDVEMPEGGGLHAAREIASCSPATAVVALSADESRQGVMQMLDAGAITYLRKGLSPAELADTLRRSIAAKQQLD